IELGSGEPRVPVTPVRYRRRHDRPAAEDPDEIDLSAVGAGDDDRLDPRGQRGQQVQPQGRGGRSDGAGLGGPPGSSDPGERDARERRVGEQDHGRRAEPERIARVGGVRRPRAEDRRSLEIDDPDRDGRRRGDDVVSGGEVARRRVDPRDHRARDRVDRDLVGPHGPIEAAPRIRDHRRCRGVGMRRLSSRTMTGQDTMEPLERLLNLVGLLLESPTPLTFEQIRETLEAYQGDNLDSVKRKFERDKDMLRAYGVPLEMTGTDVWDVEQGYTIRKDRYYLPDIAFTPEEITALYLAAQSGPAPTDAVSGVRKLIYGVDGGVL